MNPAKAKEIITIRLKGGRYAHEPDFFCALKLAIPALDLMEKVTAIYNTSTGDLHLLQVYCESCLAEQWHVITKTGRLECLNCRAK